MRNLAKMQIILPQLQIKFNPHYFPEFGMKSEQNIIGDYDRLIKMSIGIKFRALCNSSKSMYYNEMNKTSTNMNLLNKGEYESLALFF